jgi:3-hydroxypropanoate dehydrogenase
MIVSEFFPEGHVKSNALCNLGYGDPRGLFPWLPRLAFNEAGSLLQRAAGGRKRTSRE